MKKPQNDSFYKVGTKYMYEQFADSTNFKKVNMLPKVKLIHRGNAYLFGANCQAKMMSQ